MFLLYFLLFLYVLYCTYRLTRRKPRMEMPQYQLPLYGIKIDDIIFFFTLHFSVLFPVLYMKIAFKIKGKNI